MLCRASRTFSTFIFRRFAFFAVSTCVSLLAPASVSYVYLPVFSSYRCYVFLAVSPFAFVCQSVCRLHQIDCIIYCVVYCLSVCLVRFCALTSCSLWYYVNRVLRFAWNFSTCRLFLFLMSVADTGLCCCLILWWAVCPQKNCQSCR